MGTAKELENRIRRKNVAVWLVGLLWILLSGVFFYLCYFSIDILGIVTILTIVAFAIHVSVGFTLKTPALLIRNMAVYPFGIVVAQILNEASPKWNYSEWANPVNFSVAYWFGFLILYMMSSILAFFLLRSVTGYETTQRNPIVSYSFRLGSTKEDIIVGYLKNFIRLFENAKPKIIKEKELTWMKFQILPNSYAIAFAPRNGKMCEVNLCSYQMRSDILCEPMKEEAEIIASVVNGIFTALKKQGAIDDWRTENTPKYSEIAKDALLRTYANPAKIPLKIPSIQQTVGNTIDWIERNKKQIIIIIFTAIISPIIVYVVTRSFFG